MGVVKWLESFFEECCDGDWEHGYGIDIKSLENSGWVVEIDLEDTVLEYRYFDYVEFKRSDNDWIKCRTVDKFFIGEGGIRNLEEIIRIFINWSNLKLHIETEDNI